MLYLLPSPSPSYLRWMCLNASYMHFDCIGSNFRISFTKPMGSHLRLCPFVEYWMRRHEWNRAIEHKRNDSFSIERGKGEIGEQAVGIPTQKKKHAAAFSTFRCPKTEDWGQEFFRRRLNQTACKWLLPVLPGELSKKILTSRERERTHEFLANENHTPLPS